jgi:hypothetical protein
MPDEVEAKLQFTIEFPQPVTVWVLQAGGWLPIQFTGASFILVDRCVAGAARDLAANPDRTDMEPERWWLNALNSARFNLNAILCATEGWTAATPTYDAFCAELMDATATLADNFPNARIVRHDLQNLPTLYELFSAAWERKPREESFLAAVAPLLVDRVAANRTRKVERQVIEIARSNSLQPHSFVVLAALSCLYEPQGGEHPRVGRGVLKLTPGYTKEEMHNALSDIWSLEYLAMSCGLPGPAIGLCTRDKSLAAFWTYLNVKEATSTVARFSPQPELFPRLQAKDAQELLLRLQ